MNGKIDMSKNAKDKTLAEALVSVRKELPAVFASGKIGSGSYGYKYVSDSDILNSVNPILDKHKVLIYNTAITDQSMKEIQLNSGKFQYVFTAVFTWEVKHAVSGETITIQSLGSGADALDKHVYKATTGARKYAIRTLLRLESTDDPDATSSEDTTQPMQKNRENKGVTAFVSDIKGQLLSCQSEEDLQKLLKTHKDNLVKLKDKHKPLAKEIQDVVNSVVETLAPPFNTETGEVKQEISDNELDIQF